ncbi:MAG: hypothetical protein RL711_1621 [Bacteroidota bacterium]
MLALEALTNQVGELAKTVGVFIRQEANHFDSSKIEHKGVNDLVSYVDKEAEKLIVKGLKKILPEAGFLTEEGTELANLTDLYWVVVH